MNTRDRFGATQAAFLALGAYFLAAGVALEAQRRVLMAVAARPRG